MIHIKKNIHVYAAISSRVVNIFFGGVLLFIIPYTIDEVTQGYIFAFLSLMALQYAFDFGLNQTLIQIVASNIKLNSCKIINLCLYIKKIYIIVAALFFVFVFPIGLIVFTGKSNSNISWFIPWLIMTFFTAINLYLSPLISILEGSGEVTRVYVTRAIGNFIGYTFAIVLLYFEFGLISITFISIINSIVTILSVRKNNLLFPTIIRSDTSFNWKKEIFPLQWKIGLSWIFGYIVQQLTPAIVFNRLGEVEAGKIGLITSMLNAICMLALSILSANVPKFTMLLSENKKDDLNTIFKIKIFQSLLFMIILCHFFYLAIYIMKTYNFEFINRLPDLIDIYLLILVYNVNFIIYCLAIYVRSFGDDPTVFMTIIMGTLITISVYLLSIYGIKYFLLLNFFLTIFIALPWMCIIFRKYYYGSK